MTKSIFASKTFWVNALATGAAVLVGVQGQDFIQAHPGAVAAIGATISTLNIWLRFVTSEPVALK